MDDKKLSLLSLKKESKDLVSKALNKFMHKPASQGTTVERKGSKTDNPNINNADNINNNSITHSITQNTQNERGAFQNSPRSHGFHYEAQNNNETSLTKQEKQRRLGALYNLQKDKEALEKNKEIAAAKAAADRAALEKLEEERKIALEAQLKAALESNAANHKDLNSRGSVEEAATASKNINEANNTNTTRPSANSDNRIVRDFVGNKPSSVAERASTKRGFSTSIIEDKPSFYKKPYEKGREFFQGSGRRGKKYKVPHIRKEGIINIEKKSITARELAVILSDSKKRVLRALYNLDSNLKEDDFLPQELVELVALELGYEVKFKVSANEKLLSAFKKGQKADNTKLVTRPPVVIIMGHIDHGKTTLLDALRNSNIVDTEASGITQHIGAYQITARNGEKITIVDTPGHAAFTSMRMRGATITDIVILIIAADDGVNEQTIEAIKHIKAANVPMIVAINKIDKNSANPQKVLNELLQHGVITEDNGGDIMYVKISAKEKINLDKLEEAILLQAELLELRADPTANTAGVVIESRLDKRSGASITLLVTNGTLKIGQVIIVEKFFGKIKGMLDSHGQKIKEAGPSAPVEIMGLNGVPEPGSKFSAVNNEKEAKAIIDLKSREALNVEKPKITRSYFDDDRKKLNFIIKADVSGSVEAISQSLKLIKNDEIDIKMIHQGVGDINESDIELAKTSNAYIIGFRVKQDQNARTYEKLILQSVIYHVLDSVNELIIKILGPKTQEKSIGIAEVKEVFILSDSSVVAGCYIRSGFIKNDSKVKIIRNNETIHSSTVKTLKRFKEDAKEVKVGYECGIGIDGYNKIAVGDIIEAFKIEII